MFKSTMTVLLAGVFLVTALPKFSFAQEQSSEQVIQAQRKQQREDAKNQLLVLKATLADMQTELQKEQGKFGFVAAKWARNLSLIVALGSAVSVVVSHNHGSTSQFLGSVIIASASSLATILTQITVALTNDQVVMLEKKIEALQKKVEVAQAQLNKESDM